jgi:hypothetical protein
MESARWQAGKLQRLNRAIRYLRLWPGARRNTAHQTRQVVIEDGLSHLGAA